MLGKLRGRVLPLALRLHGVLAASQEDGDEGVVSRGHAQEVEVQVDLELVQSRSVLLIPATPRKITRMLGSHEITNRPDTVATFIYSA